MPDPTEYVKAVIRKALEDGAELGTERRVDLVYRMLVAGGMLASHYRPQGCGDASAHGPHEYLQGGALRARCRGVGAGEECDVLGTF
jgi:hypothetical protein